MDLDLIKWATQWSLISQIGWAMMQQKASIFPHSAMGTN